MTTSTGGASHLGLIPTNAALALFESISRITWEWLGQARQLRLSFSEETVTDIAALQIAGAASRLVRVVKATKQQERQYGLDWMWFIGSPSQGYRRYVVQAKKITLNSSPNFSYRIRHRVSRTPGSEFQMERLQRCAIRARATPLYCFYNNVGLALATRYWHCRTYPKQPDDIRQMGCTIVPLDVVEAVHRPHHRKDFSSVHQDNRSMPWRCLFHPSCLAAIHRQPDRPYEFLTGRSSQDRKSALPRPESLPEFLLQDNPVVDMADVIQQLELMRPYDDLDSDVSLASSARSVIPEWFVVIESDPN